MSGYHGLTYTSRDGDRTWELIEFLTQHPTPSDLPRPERDVLASLLRFCLEGLEYLDARERFPSLDLATAIPSRLPMNEGDGRG